jgi:DNA polymerase III epsilon subunit-like protein
MSKKLPEDLFCIFFDTETSGFISTKLPPNHSKQAWCVQLAAVVTKGEEEIDGMNVLIKAGKRWIHPNAEKIHGISVDKSNKEGIQEVEAMNTFLDLINLCSNNLLFVCHNYLFDERAIRQLFERTKNKIDIKKRNNFEMIKKHVCTMANQKIVSFCKLPYPSHLKTKPLSHYKWPKLAELYNILFDKEFKNAHDALADAKATKECFFELVKRGIINV